jgi:hypothetical protein
LVVDEKEIIVQSNPNAVKQNKSVSIRSIHIIRVPIKYKT